MAAVLDELEAWLAAIAAAPDLTALSQLRVRYLGRRGLLTHELRALGELDAAARPAAGKRINNTKAKLSMALTERQKALEQALLEATLAIEAIDVSLPARGTACGGLHPLTLTCRRIIGLFEQIGFTTVVGDDLEDEFHNFDALNFPRHHPAREMQDTFYCSNGKLLRTHTSAMQIRTMMQQKPPLSILSPGRVYRCDSDKTHSPMFHQIEGLLVSESTSFAHLKSVLHHFIHCFFERDDAQLRFRPSFFPFTEPSAEVDIRFQHDQSWLEVLGCGMVHPQVLSNCNIDSERYLGFAFGMGVERFAMLRYGIDDMSHFFDNDLRFLQQFR